MFSHAIQYFAIYLAIVSSHTYATSISLRNEFNVSSIDKQNVSITNEGPPRFKVSDLLSHYNISKRDVVEDPFVKAIQSLGNFALSESGVPLYQSDEPNHNNGYAELIGVVDVQGNDITDKTVHHVKVLEDIFTGQNLHARQDLDWTEIYNDVTGSWVAKIASTVLILEGARRINNAATNLYVEVINSQLWRDSAWAGRWLWRKAVNWSNGQRASDPARIPTHSARRRDIVKRCERQAHFVPNHLDYDMCAILYYVDVDEGQHEQHNGKTPAKTIGVRFLNFVYNNNIASVGAVLHRNGACGARYWSRYAIDCYTETYQRDTCDLRGGSTCN